MKAINNQNSGSVQNRKQYESPFVAEYGKVSHLTAGQSVGNALDQTFPTGTPKNDLTFS